MGLTQTLNTNDIVYKIYTDIDSLDRDDSLWGERLISTLSMLKDIESGAELLQYYILYQLREDWDNQELKFRMKYDNQFTVLATRHTGLDWKTVENYLRAVETYLIQRKGPPGGVVSVPVRDKYKKLVKDETGHTKMKSVPWSPIDCSISKLHVARSAVNEGKMEPETWTLLADSNATRNDLISKIYGEGNKNGDTPDITFSLDGPLLIAHRYGQEVELGEIFQEVFENDELGHDALLKLFSMLGIKLDTDQINEQLRRNTIAYNPNNQEDEEAT